MADPFDQRDWVQRVLDVSVGIGAAAKGPSVPLLPIWVDAKEELDGDIDKLQRALRDDGDEELSAIADYGLHGVTNGQSVRLMAALRDADSQKSNEALATAADAVQAFRDFLGASPGISVIEENPFDLKVPVRAKLGGALDEISKAMRG